MKIAVCVKEVPDMESHFAIDPTGQRVKEEGLAFKINSFDEFAIEEALKIKGNAGGEVILVNLGPDRAKQTIRKGLAMGADRAIQLIDPVFEGSDSLATAKLLAQAINPLNCDLVFAGVQAEDDGCAQVGVILAHLLNYAHTSIAIKLVLAPDKKSLTVHRELEGGMIEVAEVQLPAVVTIQSGINTPRYASLPGIMQAKRKEIKEIRLPESGLSADAVGEKGRTVIVEKLYFPEKGKTAEMIQGDAKQAVQKLVQKLKESKLL